MSNLKILSKKKTIQNNKNFNSINTTVREGKIENIIHLKIYKMLQTSTVATTTTIKEYHTNNHNIKYFFHLTYPKK